MISKHKLEKIENEEFWRVAKEFSEKEVNSIVARTNTESCNVISWMMVRDNCELSREYMKGNLYRRRELTLDEIHENKVDELVRVFTGIYIDITDRSKVSNDDATAIITMAEYAINNLGGESNA